jgi:adenine-specific DNA-methyltransferase
MDTPVGEIVYRHYKYNLEKLTIPKPDGKVSKQIESLVATILEKDKNNQDTTEEENKINQILYSLYGLSAEEIAFIENED